MSENIDQLIATLSQSLYPARNIKRPGAVFFAWLVGACAYGLLLNIGQFHYRQDLGIKIMQPMFFAEVISLAAIAASSLLSAVLLSFPDLAQSRRLVYAPLLAMTAFVIVLILEWLADTPPAAAPAHNMECCGAITLFALPLSVFILMGMRRMAPTHPALAGCCALVSSFSVSALALRLSEQTDSISHLMKWHYLPMFVFAALGLWLGRKILKW